VYNVTKKVVAVNKLDMPNLPTRLGIKKNKPHTSTTGIGNRSQFQDKCLFLAIDV
jgi:hypothetical protein